MNVLLLGLLAFSSWTALQAQNPNTGAPPREAEEAKEVPAKAREAESDPPALYPRIKQPAQNPAENTAAESLFQRGVQAYGAENYEAAIDFLEKAVQAAPGVSRYHDWLGKAYGRRAERVIFIRAIVLARKARNEFARAAELDPTNIEAWSDLLDYDLQAPGFLGGGLDRAKAVAAKLATLNAAEGHRAQALIRAAEKDHAGAEREYREALALEPANPGRLLELASFLNERRRYAEADALFDQAEKLAPDSPDYLFTRGQQLVASKRDPDRARQLLQAYLRSNRKPEDPPPSEVQGLLKKLL